MPPYLHVDEIEAGLAALAGHYPASQLLTLPNATTEGRSSHALRIGSDLAAVRPVLVVLGGVHAREWVPPDACLAFAADLLEAHERSTGLRYGQSAFTAADVRRVVDGLHVVVFPCVNPDGRRYSQETEPMWRGNRRLDANPGSSGFGVDVNRNFPFLWDFDRRFAASAGVATSTDPSDSSQTYRGHAPGSEPETKNVMWLLDSLPSARWLVDVHSFSELILHPWGDDEDQSSEPAKNFGNPAFDAVRGMAGDAYREFIEPSDFAAARSLAKAVQAAIGKVRGRPYTVEQGFGLYPTSGTSDDYAFSRHATTPGVSKVLGFTIECGREFQPDQAEADDVIREVSAGLLAFASAVA